MEKNRFGRVVSLGLLCSLGVAGCSTESTPQQASTPPARVTSPGPEVTRTPFMGPEAPRSASPKATKLAVVSCVARNPERWTRTPAAFRADAIARVLKVAPQDVANGVRGYVECKTPVDLNRVPDGLMVSVSGIDVDKCLAVGGDALGMTRNVDVVCTVSKSVRV